MSRNISLSLLFVFAASISFDNSAFAQPTDELPIPIILDTDLGTDVDDAWALVMAATHPRLDLRAVTVFRKKADVRAALARKMLLLMNRPDVIVAKGAEETLSGKPTYFGGWEGKGVLQKDEVVEGIDERTGAQVIIDVAKESKRPITIVTVGGVTNVALALRQAPEIKTKIARIAIMGGSVHPIVVAGKTLPQKWESNLGSDLDAAKEVLSCGLPITITPAEVTFHAKLLKDDYEPFRNLDTPLAKGMVAMTDIWAAFVKSFAKGNNAEEYYKDTVVFLHDPLALYALVEPSAVTTVPTRIRLELTDTEIKLIEDPAGPIAIDLHTACDVPKLSKAAAEALERAIK